MRTRVSYGDHDVISPIARVDFVPVTYIHVAGIAHVGEANRAGLVDQERRRHPLDAKRQRRRAFRIEQDGHLMWMRREERVCVSAIFVKVHCQHFEAATLVLTEERVECGKRCLAGDAPACPEVDEQHSAGIGCERHGGTVSLLQHDVRRVRGRRTRRHPWIRIDEHGSGRTDATLFIATPSFCQTPCRSRSGSLTSGMAELQRHAKPRRYD